jgi:hypothetical protein
VLGLVALLLLCSVGPASAQALAVGDPFEDYLRLLQITGRASPGSFTVRPLTAAALPSEGGSARHPWSERAPDGGSSEDQPVSFSLLDPRLEAFANSRFPTGRNDGPVWQGRGLTTSVEAGGRVRWRGVSLTVRPRLLYTENRSFELAPVVVANTSEYAYPWHIIDMPQRFGPDAFWTVDPGDSEVRVEAGDLTLGLSTGAMWWGPGLRNAIIMSNNAPGFPHAFVGTRRPLGTGIGEFEARWIWGRLRQSEWFDPLVPNEEDRFITGIVGSYSPSFLDGLTIGIARVFTVLVPEEGVSLGDYFAVLSGLRKRAMISPSNPSGDDAYDQLASVFGRWVLSNSGFEVYWEWARNDHSWELRDFLLEPEHSQAYTIGLQKAIDLDQRNVLALRAELTHLEADPTFQVRPKGTYYQHAPVTQGYTHRGQIIGAGIGPGGNSQYIGLDHYGPSGRLGLYLERQVHDNDAYYTWAAANDETYCCHDVSLHIGGHALRFVGGFDLGAGFVMTREYNRYFFGGDLWNLNLSLSARWRMGAS